VYFTPNAIGFRVGTMRCVSFLSCRLQVNLKFQLLTGSPPWSNSCANSHGTMGLGLTEPGHQKNWTGTRIYPGSGPCALPSSPPRLHAKPGALFTPILLGASPRVLGQAGEQKNRSKSHECDIPGLNGGLARIAHECYVPNLANARALTSAMTIGDVKPFRCAGLLIAVVLGRPM